jgi:regulatory protein
MPLVTQITEQKRRPNRRNIYLDGKFAFGVNLNVVARFKLKVGQDLSPREVAAIEAGELRQECFDKALCYVGSRPHSRSELHKKLMKREYGEAVIAHVLDELERLNYVDDARFAATKALGAAERKHHGRRRAFVELRKAGVKSDVANAALDTVYDSTDTTAIARQLVEKQLPRLKKLDPQTARRRLVGMLQRRGFDYDDIKPVVDQAFRPTDDD